MSDRDLFGHSSENDPLAPQWASPNGDQPAAPSSPFATEQPAASESPAAPYVTPSPYAQPSAVQPSPYTQPAENGQPGFPPQAPGQYASVPPSPYGQPLPVPDAPYAAPGSTPWNQTAYAQPGIIPLRPLAVSDLFEGTFKAIRSNPSVMFGFTMTAMTVVGLLAAVITYFVPSEALAESLVKSRDFGFTYKQAAQMADQLTSSTVFALVSMVALHIVSGVLSTSVSDAVIGRKTDLPSAWNRVKGRIPALIGSTFLLFIITLVWIVSVTFVFILAAGGVAEMGRNAAAALFIVFVLLPLLLIAYLYFPVRMLYSGQSIVLERQGVFASIGRSWKLTRKNFWSTFGRYLLILIVTGIIQALIQGFVGLIIAIAGPMIPMSFMSTISLFISALLLGVVFPLTASYLTLMYIDRRIRLEGLADSLLKASQN